MAVVSGYSRDDPKYVKFLEDEFVRREREDKRIKEEKTASGTDESQADAIQSMSLSIRHMTDKLASLKTNVSSLRDASSSHSGAAAEDLLSAPLTKALSYLSMEDDEEGRLLRPETYAQSDLKGRNRDYTKMDTVDLLFGWVSVADFW